MNIPLLMFSGLALKDVLTKSVLPDFTQRTGLTVEAVFDPTGVLVNRIAAGERPDLMIGVHKPLRALTEGDAPVLSAATLRPLARSGIGIAVPLDHAAPAIGSVDELRQTLLESARVAYSRTGASGLYFAELLRTLEIADAVNERACVVDKGFVAETLLDGRAELAVQQVVELASVEGIQIVGPLPDAVQQHVELSVAAAPSANRAEPLLEFLVSAQAAREYRAVGLEPIFEVKDE